MGLCALTRELHANERPQLLAHLLALDAEDRHLRFAHMLSDDGIRHYVEGIDLTRGAVFVVTGIDLEIIGAAHLAREDGNAQLGISVLPRSRGQGIGGALLERCAARARNWGMRVMFMNCLVENAAMMHLARKQGLKIRRRRSIRALAARRPDQSGRGGSRRAARVIRPRPEILLGGAAGPTSAKKDFRRRNSQVDSYRQSGW
jgi:ribosomal protein S18 acetylase RimI-like enzyme